LRIRSPIAISPLASLCGCQAGRLFERGNPAEPDDPNSSSPDPNVDGKKEMCKENSPCLLHFYDFLFCQKAILWPGSRGVARKKHRPSYFGFRISDFFGFSLSIRIPQSTIRNFVRRAHRAPSRAPLHPNNPVLTERTICPPGPRNGMRLMVFPRNAPASWPGNP